MITSEQVWDLYNRIWDFKEKRDKERPANWNEYFEAERVLEDEVNKMDKDAGKGLQIGRVLRFQVADGYAQYLIVEIKPRTVKALHLPLGDAYANLYAVTKTGSCKRSIAEQNVNGADAWDRIFASNKS